MSIRTAQDLRDAYRQFNEAALSNPNATLADMRANAEGFGDMTSEPAGVKYEQVDAGGVPAIMVTPDGAAADRVLQYTHGGGYVFGSLRSHGPTIVMTSRGLTRPAAPAIVTSRASSPSATSASDAGLGSTISNAPA